MADQPHGKPSEGGNGGGGGKKGPPASGHGLKFEEVVIMIATVALLAAVFGIFTRVTSDGFPVPEILSTIHNFLVTTATVISMIALVIGVYAFMRISEISQEETKKLGLQLDWNSERKQKNVRWERVELYMTSLNPSDWKIAILEADNILDEITLRMGYKGETLGERMKNIEASDFPYLEEAWGAHKTRNAIAHKGTDYVITRSDAEQTINIYHRVFRELGYL